MQPKRPGHAGPQIQRAAECAAEQTIEQRPTAGLSRALRRHIGEQVARANGWLPFDRFMALALYTPGLGYYSRGGGQIGRMPAGGSDFVTAPVLSPLFGATLAHGVAQVLDAAALATVIEFGAGTGALAEQVLDALGDRVQHYQIVDVSGSLRATQQQRLARFAPRVQWLDAWPEHIEAVVLGNEVLDAMPVQLLAWDGAQWLERGVVVAGTGGGDDGGDQGADETGDDSVDPHFAWSDRPTALRPPHAGPYLPGTVTEIHPQAEAFMRTLATHLHRGAAFFIDYGFPEAEYYHLQRTGGTLMCHRAHRADTDPLADVGAKDITAHVNFSAVALAAQDAGLDVLGYTSQAHFLLNCGLTEQMATADLRARTAALTLIQEHEMGELFKVLGLARGLPPGFECIGFARGDRSHTL